MNVRASVGPKNLVFGSILVVTSDVIARAIVEYLRERGVVSGSVVVEIVYSK